MTIQSSGTLNLFANGQSAGAGENGGGGRVHLKVTGTVTDSGGENLSVNPGSGGGSAAATGTCKAVGYTVSGCL